MHLQRSGRSSLFIPQRNWSSKKAEGYLLKIKEINPENPANLIDPGTAFGVTFADSSIVNQQTDLQLPCGGEARFPIFAAMSKVTHEMLDRLAMLTRLEIPEDKRESYLEDFARMLDFVDQLSAIDTTGVAPLVHPIEETVTGAPDVPVTDADTQGILAQSPAPDPNYFRVPKVMKK